MPYAHRRGHHWPAFTQRVEPPVAHSTHVFVAVVHACTEKAESALFSFPNGYRTFLQEQRRFMQEARPSSAAQKKKKARPYSAFRMTLVT